MAQQLRVLAILVEDQASVPRTHQQLTTVYNFSSRVSDAFFWSPQAIDAHYTQIYKQENPHTSKKNIKMSISIKILFKFL